MHDHLFILLLFYNKKPIKSQNNSFAELIYNHISYI